MSNYPQQALVGSMNPQMEPVKHRLEQEQKRLEARLVEVKEALVLLERNPDVERLLNILNR